MPELVPTELSPSTPSKDFGNVVKDAFKKFPDPEQSARAVEFFLNKLMVKTQVKFGLFAGLLDLQPPSKLDISPYLDDPMETRRIG